MLSLHVVYKTKAKAEHSTSQLISYHFTFIPHLKLASIDNSSLFVHAEYITFMYHFLFVASFLTPHCYTYDRICTYQTTDNWRA